MSPRIFAVTLRGGRLLLALLAAAMVGFQLLIASSYRPFGEVTAQLLREVPREWMAFLKTQPGLSAAGDATAYLGLGYYHPLFLVVGTAAGVAIAAGSLAGEVDRRTILYLLARPISRWRVVLSKGAALVPATALVPAAALGGTALAVRLMGLDAEVWRFSLVALNAWTLFAALAAVGLLCSALAHSAGQAAGGAVGFALVSFFVDFLADLWEPVRGLEPLSVFAHYDPGRVIANGQLAGDDLVFLVGVVAASALLAGVAFTRRDILA